MLRRNRNGPCGTTSGHRQVSLTVDDRANRGSYVVSAVAGLDKYADFLIDKVECPCLVGGSGAGKHDATSGLNW